MSGVKRSAGHAAAKSRHRDAVGNVVIAGAGQEEDHAPGIVIGDGLLATEGPLWKTRHAMIQPLLRRGEMAALAPVVQRAAARRRGGSMIGTQRESPVRLFLSSPKRSAWPWR